MLRRLPASSNLSMIEGSEEYHVGQITGEGMVRCGCGSRNQYRVKWTDAEPLEDVAALENYNWEAIQWTLTGCCAVGRRRR